MEKKPLIVAAEALMSNRPKTRVKRAVVVALSQKKLNPLVKLM
jgi:hypothetical protein